MPKTVVEKLVACLDEEIYKDHKMEIEAKKALDRQIAGFAEKESRLIVLFTEGSITQDLYTKKLTEYRQDKKKLEERLTDYIKHDNILLEKLNKELDKKLADITEESDKLWFAVPEIVRWEDIEGFYFGRQKTALKDDLDLIEYKQYIFLIRGGCFH